MTEEEVFKAHKDDIVSLDILNQLRLQMVEFNETKDIKDAIDKACKDGAITLDVANQLKQQKKNIQIPKENSKAKFNENLEMDDIFFNGEISKEESIAFKTMLLLERNRKNTSLITSILAIQFVVSIIGALIFLVFTNS